MTIPSKTKTDGDVTVDMGKSAGQGVFWLTLAKLYFMATGFLLVVFLPALFEKLSGDSSGELYGRYRLVVGLVNLLDMVLIGGTIQAVSKFISEREDRALSVKWQTLKIQTALGGGISLALLLGADRISELLWGKQDLALYLRLAAPIVLLYSYYAVIIGCMNGLKRFRHQAMMDILFATLKVGLTVALVAAGLAISGAIGGFLATAAVLLALSTAVLGKLSPGEQVGWRSILSFEWKTLVFAFFLNAMLMVDLQLLPRLAPPELGSPESQAGIYGLALQLGQLPYIATISVAFVIFPLISRATFDRDLEKAKQYVATTNRYVVVFLAGVVSVLATEAEPILSLPFFPDVFAQGAGSFAVLLVGYMFFACMMVNANILTGAGAPSLSAALFGGMLLLSSGLNVVLIPRFGGLGAASASSLAMFAGAVAAGVMSYRRFAATVPALTILRAAAGAFGVFVAGQLLPSGTGVAELCLRLVIKFVLYCVLLWVLREVTSKEIRRLRVSRAGKR